MGLFTDTLSDTLSHLGVSVVPEQLSLLDQHFGLLVEANRRINLTRITDPADAAAKLYGDSAAVVAWAARTGVQVSSVLDVGSGAGFPAFPVAVLRTGWQVTALEATAKKVAFLTGCAERLDVRNLCAVHGHADHWSAPRAFDLITFKAVARLDGCLRHAQPHLAAGGHVLVFKTASLSTTEIEAGLRAAEDLRLSPLAPFEYELSLASGSARFALHAFQRSAG